MSLHLEVIPHDALSAADLSAVVDLCAAAFKKPFDEYIRLHSGGAHVMGRLDGALVSHATWVPRLLQPDGCPMLNTAYIEDVATHPAFQGRQFASAVMQRMDEEIQGFKFAALGGTRYKFYGRLGWEQWRGKVAIRSANGLMHSPGQSVLILRLPRTPPLELDALLTAEWREGELW